MTSNNKVADPAGVVRADELDPGMWVYPYPRSADSVPVRVLFRSEPSQGYVALVVQYAGCPSAENIEARKRFVIASEAEIAFAAEASRRKVVARQMRELAKLIEEGPDLPLPPYPSMTMPHNLSRVELERVAELVGVPVTRRYGDKHPDRCVRFGDFDTFHVEWAGAWEDEPEHVEGDAAAVVEAETPMEMKERTSPIGRPKPAPPRKAAVKRSPAVDEPKITAHAFRGKGATCSMPIEGTGDSFIRCGEVRERHVLVVDRAARDQDEAATRPAGADQ